MSGVGDIHIEVGCAVRGVEALRVTILVVVAGTGVGTETKSRAAVDCNESHAVVATNIARGHQTPTVAHTTLVETLFVRQRYGVALGMEVDRGDVALAAVANGCHSVCIVACSLKTSDGIAQVADSCNNIVVTVVDNIAICTVAVPAERDTVFGNVADSQARHIGTVGNNVQDNVVDIHSTGAFQNHDGDIGCILSSVDERYGVFGLFDTVHDDRIQHIKAANIGRIGKGSKVCSLAVRSGAHTSPETDAVTVHREVGGVDFGQDEQHGVGIGSSGRTYEIEGTATIVGIGRAANAVRIIAGDGVGRHVAIAAPGQCGDGGCALKLILFEAASPWQSHGYALGTDINNSWLGLFVCRAVSDDGETVLCVGHQVGHRVGQPANATGQNGAVDGIENSISGIVVGVILPGEGNIAASGYGLQIGDCGAGRHLADNDVVDMEVVVATRGGTLSVEGNADVLTNVLIEVNDLVNIAAAGEGGKGVVTAFVLPLDSVCLRPGGTTVGGNHNDEGLAAVVLEASGWGSARCGVDRESDIERELSGGGIAEVDNRSNQPFPAICAIDVDTVVTGVEAVAGGGAVGPCGGGTEVEVRASPDVGGIGCAVASPADIVVECNREILHERKRIVDAERGHIDSCNNRLFNIRTNSLDTKLI